MKKSIKFFVICFTFILLFKSCIDFSKCNEDISGKYNCFNDKKAINFIIIDKNKTFFHYYKKGKIELTSKGTWEKNSEGYCYIELSEWKNFNEKGEKFKEFGNGILYIKDMFLNIGPDGESSTSFYKEK